MRMEGGGAPRVRRAEGGCPLRFSCFLLLLFCAFFCQPSGQSCTLMIIPHPNYDNSATTFFKLGKLKMCQSRPLPLPPLNEEFSGLSQHRGISPPLISKHHGAASACMRGFSFFMSSNCLILLPPPHSPHDICNRIMQYFGRALVVVVSTG